jgi:hypothetical protein
MWEFVFSILKRKKKEKKETAVNIYIFSSQQFAKQAKAMPPKYLKSSSFNQIFYPTSIYFLFFW